MVETVSPILYLPIELSERELDSKLLLGLHGVQHDFQIVIGQQWLLFHNIDRLAPGIVILKGLNNIEAGRHAKAARAGHRVVGLEEEALGVIDEKHLIMGANRDLVLNLDLLIAHGDAYRDVIVDWLPEMAGKVVVCGNPRVDLLRRELRAIYDGEVARIKERFDGFVLFNTNFSWCNSAWGDKKNVYMINVRGGYFDVHNTADSRRVRARVAADETEFAAYIRLINEAATSFPNRTFIVRPHPGETIDGWRDLTKHLRNVEVIRDGSANYWTLASDLMLHRSCTTGLEALLLDRRTVSYCPFPHFYYDELIVNQVLDVVSEHDTMMGIIGDSDGWFAGRGERARLMAERLAHHLTGLTGPLASQRMIDVMRPMVSDGGCGGDPRLDGFEPTMERNEIFKNRFTVDEAKVVERIKALSHALPTLPQPEVTTIGDSLFLIRPAA
ncbi:MAG TPA: surface carbohydrate biosynthesis protein [Azospirillum sp.]